MLGTNSSFGTESIKIERGAGWDGLNLTATWHIPGRKEPLRVALLDGDAMDVPPEVTKEAKADANAAAIEEMAAMIAGGVT